MPKVRLHSNATDELVGNRAVRFGFAGVVQEDKSIVADLSDDMAKLAVEAGQGTLVEVVKVDGRTKEAKAMG